MKKIIFLAVFVFFNAAVSVSAEINPTSPTTQGKVVSADGSEGQFQIMVNGDEGLQMIFYTTPQTEYYHEKKTETYLAEEGFSLLVPGAEVSVIYTSNNDQTKSLARRVTVVSDK